jgi:hypothetical protein
MPRSPPGCGNLGFMQRLSGEQARFRNRVASVQN